MDSVYPDGNCICYMGTDRFKHYLLISSGRNTAKWIHIPKQKAQELRAKSDGRLSSFYFKPLETQMEPYQVVPGVYYVGNKYVGSYLLDTDAGLILIDAALQETDYLLFESIRKVGYDPAKIKNY